MTLADLMIPTRLARTALAVAVIAAGIAPATAGQYIEPPFLAERVAAGELPPVAERLPDNPVVVSLDGDLRPGDYGGAGQPGGHQCESSNDL